MTTDHAEHMHLAHLQLQITESLSPSVSLLSTVICLYLSLNEQSLEILRQHYQEGKSTIFHTFCLRLKRFLAKRCPGTAQHRPCILSLCPLCDLFKNTIFFATSRKIAPLTITSWELSLASHALHAPQMIYRRSLSQLHTKLFRDIKP